MNIQLNQNGKEDCSFIFEAKLKARKNSMELLWSEFCHRNRWQLNTLMPVDELVELVEAFASYHKMERRIVHLFSINKHSNE